MNIVGGSEILSLWVIPRLSSCQDFRETQVAALGAMRHYCTWTPKFHQWLHMCRTRVQNGRGMQTSFPIGQPVSN
jgi:hypothetical protein